MSCDVGLPRRGSAAIAKHAVTAMIAVFGMIAVIPGAGCELASVSLIVDLGVPGGRISGVGSALEFAIDLTGNKDFREHQHRIRSIDEVGFVLEARNHAEPAVFDLWASRTPVRPVQSDTIRNAPGARRVFAGVELPGNRAITISHGDSLDLLVDENREFLHDLVRDGSLHLYVVPAATNQRFDITVERFTIVTVVTAGL